MMQATTTEGGGNSCSALDSFVVWIRASTHCMYTIS